MGFGLPHVGQKAVSFFDILCDARPHLLVKQYMNTQSVSILLTSQGKNNVRGFSGAHLSRKRHRNALVGVLHMRMPC
jgi:hypothetical protein